MPRPAKRKDTTSPEPIIVPGVTDEDPNTGRRIKKGTELTPKRLAAMEKKAARSRWPR